MTINKELPVRAWKGKGEKNWIINTIINRTMDTNREIPISRETGISRETPINRETGISREIPINREASI